MEIIAVTNREQLEACLAIRIRVFVEEQKVPWDLEMDEYDASPDACRHILMKDGDKPAATGRWTVYEDGIAKLQRIAVMEEYRGRGVGKQLVLALEDDARRAGMRGVLLDGQCTAEGFYHSLGYATEPGEPFLDAGILHVRMTKPL